LGLWLHSLLNWRLELRVLLLRRLLINRLHELLLLKLLLWLWRLDHLLRELLLELLCRLADLLRWQYLCLRHKVHVGSHDGIWGLRLSLVAEVCNGQRCLWLTLLALWRLLVVEIGHWQGLV
jgi:hypothetical protein